MFTSIISRLKIEITVYLKLINLKKTIKIIKKKKPF